MPSTTAPITTRPVKDTRQDIQAAEKVLRTALATDPTVVPDYVRRRAQAVAAARRAGIPKVYSLYNQLSLDAQVRRHGLVHLGVYAGPRQYEEINRHVKDGVKPLIVCAPAKRKDPTTDEEKLVGWINVEVFDYTDTMADDPDFIEPEFEQPLLAGDQATFTKLASLSTTPVRRRDLGSSLERSTFDGTTVTVDFTVPIANQISALAHQVLHQRLGDVHHPASPDHEATAILAQWLFMEMAGLGTSVGNNVVDHAVADLRRWIDPATGKTIEGHKGRVRLLHQRLRAGIDLAEQLVADLS